MPKSADRKEQSIQTQLEYRAQMAENAIRRGLDPQAALHFADRCLAEQQELRLAEETRRLAARLKKK